MRNIKMLALDLDGTLTNSEKIRTPRTRAALEKAMDAGVTVVLASGRPTVGIEPLAKDLELSRRGGCILSYNGGKILDCATGETLYQKQFPAEMIRPVCDFAKEMGVSVISYNADGIVTEHPEDVWAQKEGFVCKIPLQKVESLADYLTYPVCKLLITLDPARMAEEEPEAKRRFGDQLGVFRSCDFFIEVVPQGVAKDASLAALLERRGLTRENLMAVGDGMNDLPMLRFAGVGVVMANADPAVKAEADAVTTADNDHDGVAEAIEQYIFGKK